MTESDDQLRNHAETLAALFDECEDVCLFMKNAEHRFVRCNRAMLRIYGLEDEDEAIGRSDQDFHPPMLAESYVAEDQQILRTGKPVRKAVWLVTSQVSSRWYSCTKLPVAIPAASGSRTKPTITGIAGILVPYQGSGEAPADYRRINPALELANAKFASGLRVSDMAASIGMSRNQFTRVFQELFHMTPVIYLLRLKLDHARRLLEKSQQPITEIALESGFYDHSAFTKSFRQHYGLAPREHRKRFRR